MLNQSQKRWDVMLQEPKVRPSAKYLLQHKFVVASRPSLPAAALLLLIARSRDALQAMAAAADPPVAPPSSRWVALAHLAFLLCSVRTFSSP